MTFIILAALVVETIVLANGVTHIMETNAAIQQCESELPRHLSCEPVYGAKVIPNKTNGDGE